MQDEVEFLEYIYQNSKMGKDTIMQIMKERNEEDDFSSLLKEQLEDYKKISCNAQNMLEERRQRG